jgi:hypothetical protein
MTVTVRQVMDDALALIGEAAGAGVQVYDEDEMLKMVVRSFNMIFKKFFWPQYCMWQRVTLDGTTGQVTSNTAFTKVRSFEDFGAVHFDGKQEQVPRLPRFINPYTLTGTRAQYWTSMHASDLLFATKRLQFYPITATDSVNVYARIHPKGEGEPWSDTDTMELDADMLMYGAAFMGLNGSDLNPNAAETNKQMMEMRYRDITAALSGVAIPLSAGHSGIPSEWH